MGFDTIWTVGPCPLLPTSTLSSLTTIPITHALINHHTHIHRHAHTHIHIQFATEAMLYELRLTDDWMIVLKLRGK